MRLKTFDIVKLRLTSQQLVSTGIKTGSEMVAWFGAVQGQEYSQTKWGLGLRMPNLKDADIEKELTEGKILRTHLLRPTWHFVAPADIRWLLKLTAPRIHAVSASMYRKLELDGPFFNRCNRILLKVLQGGRHLSRTEIGREFHRNNIKAEGQRLAYIMAQAELNAVVCSGARRDKQFTYALLDERAQNSTVLSREESLAALARRYFVSRGPATVHDFSTWSGLTITDCKLGIHLNKDLLENADADNKTYYFSNQLIPGNRNGSRIFFLPPYDEYIMGYKDRSAILRYKNSILINPPLLFYFYCMIVYDGQIVGTWKRTPEKNRILLEYVLFDKTADHKEELEKVIRRFSEFNEMVVQHN